MKVLWSIVFAVLFGLGLQGHPADSLFDRACSRYADSAFTEAEGLFRSIEDSGYLGYELFYNLGNTYYRLGEFGRSILYYERALKEKPGEEDARFNLSLAREQLMDEYDEPPRGFWGGMADKLTGFFTVHRWAVISVGFFYLFLAGLLGIAVMRKHRLRIFRLTLIPLLLCALSYGAASLREYRTELQHYGIVISPNVYVQSTPGGRGEDLFILHEGTKAAVRSEIEEGGEQWYKIRLADGKTGYVRKGDFEAI